MIQSIVARLGLDAGDFHRELKRAQSKTESMGAWMGKALGSISWKTFAAAAAVGTAAAVAFGRAMLRTADELKDTSEMLGLTVEDVQRLQYGFGQAGTSSEKFAKGFNELNKKIGEARNGSDAAIDAFARAGVTLEDLATLSNKEIFMKVADGVKNSRDQVEALTKSSDIFGKSAKNMNSLLMTGADGVRESYSGAIIASESAVNKAAELADKMEAIKTNIMAASLEIMNVASAGVKGLWEGWNEGAKTGNALEGALKGAANSAAKQYIEDVTKGSENAGKKMADPITVASDKAAKDLEKASEKWRDMWEDAIDRLGDTMDKAADSFAQFSNQSSQAQGSEARGNRKAARAQKRAVKRYDLNDKGTVENPEGAKRMLRDADRGKINLSPDERARLEQLATDGTVTPSGAPEPPSDTAPKSTGEPLEPSKVTEDPTATPKAGTSQGDMLTVLKNIETNTKSIADKYGNSI
jgi:hypothetical protein